MPYRRAEAAELLEIVPKLQAFAQWQNMRQLIAETYGLSAVRVLVEVGSQYNDEYHNPDPEVTAYDVAGMEVLPDYDLPFFARITLTQEEQLEQEQQTEDARRTWPSYWNPDDYVEEDILEWKRTDAFNKRITQALALPNAVDGGYQSSFTFDFIKTPELPLLFVEETRSQR
jgi:hypothetical protein